MFSRLSIGVAQAGRTFSTSSQNNVKVAVCGASGGIGQPLSLLLKQSPLVTQLHLYDIVHTPGVAADLSHIDTPAVVRGFNGAENLDAALKASYSDGFKVVREKVAQRYNTSSSEDELQAAMFRRKHPGLVSQSKNFECVFKKDRQAVREVGEEQQTTDTIIETSNCENHGHEERTVEMFGHTQSEVSEGLQENGKNTAKENCTNEIVTPSSTDSAVRLNHMCSIDFS